MLYKLQISPTKLELLKAIKTCDIISPSSQGLAGDNCYASVNIKVLETLRYAEHICNYVVILDSWFYGKVSVIS